MAKQRAHCWLLRRGWDLVLWACTVFYLMAVHAAVSSTTLISANSRKLQGVTPSTRWTALDVMRIKCGWTRGSSVDGNEKEDSGKDSVPATACWVYTGSLQDPLTGHIICSVQGVELVQGVVSFQDSNDGSNDENNDVTKSHSRSRFQRRCQSLQVATNLATPLTTRHRRSTRTQGGTMLSRKLFCYTQESDNGNQLLETFRKRMGGPTTHVPLDQSVTVFDSAVSCLSRDEVSDSDSQKTRMLLHTEWPGGADRATWSNVQFKNEQAESSRSGSVAKASSKATKAKAAAAKAKAAPLDSLEFAVYANQQSRSWNEKDWEVAAAVTDSASSTRVVPRSAWIQLGGSDKSSKGVGALGTGARETYVYRSSLDENDETTTTVRYTRYGEAPVWYGPGRFCQLELTGRRLLLPDRQQNGDDDNANLFAELRPYVPVAAHVIQQHLPRFCKFGLPLTSRPKKLPLPARGRRQKRVQGKDDDDPVFAYYAKALHSALTDEAIDTSDTMATLYSSGTSADQMTCADYRRFYHDLAVGRYMHRFCQARPGNDRNGYQQDFLHSLPYHHHDDPDGLNTATTRTQRARRQQLYRMLQTGAFKLQYYWNKFRSATSISIGEF